MTARRLTAFAAAGTIVLAACSGGGDSDAQVETGTPAATAAPEPATEPSEPPADDPAPESDEPASEPADAPEPTAAPVDEPESEPADAAAPTTDAPVAVPPILDVSATTIDGSEIELGAYAGRPVLLWFWAPW